MSTIKPEHFDVLGALAFVFISAFAFHALFFGTAPRWAVVVLLVIGLVGLAVDFSIVYKYFIKK